MPQHANESPLDATIGMLRCPECRGDLFRGEAGLACRSCSRNYEVYDGIPLLARTGGSEQWAGPSDEASSIAYQRSFLEPGIGERYRQRYQRRWSKRCSTRREIERLERLLASQERCRRLLDIPCGGGRVSGPLVAATELLLQADLSLGQVMMARKVMEGHGDIVHFTASAFMIPLRDGAVDGVVCNRLTHHLPPAEQERLIHELLRVATRFVIVSYYDHNSFKSLGRRIRGGPPGHTMRRADLRDLAARNGGAVRADIPLWCRGSRLRYVLLQKHTDSTCQAFAPCRSTRRVDNAV